MLSFEQIKELLDLVAARGVAGVEIQQGDFRLRIDGHVAHPAGPPSAPAGSAAQPAAGAPEPAPEGHILESPIVGTFYQAPSPEAGPYVRVGDRVEKGQVICIVEAMKLMNEIEADVSGVVVKIFPENAQPVEFGEPLFCIQADG